MYTKIKRCKGDVGGFMGSDILTPKFDNSKTICFYG
jgi:hypothetical protein